MGLDMYLYATKGSPPGNDDTYLAGYDFMRGMPTYAAEVERFDGIVERLGISDILTSDSPHLHYLDDQNVDVCAVYWRKENAIHEWFVRNAQDGVDECQMSDHIDVEQLAHLVALCRTVVDDPSKAAELLPTQAGFFFGSTEFDEWYFEGLKTTAIEIETLVQKIIARPDRAEWSFRYRSSW